MKKDVEKRTKVLKKLSNEILLELHIFDAIEGNKLTKEEINRYANWDEFCKRHNQATLPALGCSMSHYFIYCDIYKKKLTSALVLEDDVLISDTFGEKILPLVDFIERNNIPSVILLNPGFHYYKKNEIYKTEDVSVYKLNNGVMTSGYLINLAAAELLSKVLVPIRMFADDWGEMIKLGLNVYGVVPHITSYPDTYGEIGLAQLQFEEKHKENYLQKIFNKIRYKMKQLAGRKYSVKNW